MKYILFLFVILIPSISSAGMLPAYFQMDGNVGETFFSSQTNSEWEILSDVPEIISKNPYYNFTAQGFYNECTALNVINQFDGVYYLYLCDAPAPFSFPAYLSYTVKRYLVAPASYSSLVNPTTFEQFVVMAAAAARDVPPDEQLMALQRIDTKLTSIAGDPVNDTLVPEALRGKVSSPQYFALMGVSGLLSAFVIFQVWSRAF